MSPVRKGKQPAPANESDDDEDSDDEDSDAESASDEEDDAIAEKATPEEAEKQFKREKLVRGAIAKILEKNGPFSLEELPKVLETVGVKSFTPQICGYATLRKFAKSQPKKYIRFDKTTNVETAEKEEQ